VTEVVLAVVAVCGVAAAAQAVTGFGFALVAVPVLALVLGPVPAVVTVTLVGMVLTGFTAYGERRHVLVRPATRMVVGGVVGMPLGLVALSRLDADALHLLIAVTVAGLVVLQVLGMRLPPGARTQWGAGGVSGALLASTGVNGPPLVLALQADDLPPRAFRGTLQAAFFSQDLVAVVAFAVVGLVDRHLLVLAAAGSLAVPLGWAAGDRLFARIPADRFRSVVLACLMATALASVAGAVV
jgi:uncharacterized membrane protein YfcA